MNWPSIAAMSGRGFLSMSHPKRSHDDVPGEPPRSIQATGVVVVYVAAVGSIEAGFRL
jgi:hypothetical protein